MGGEHALGERVPLRRTAAGAAGVPVSSMNPLASSSEIALNTVLSLMPRKAAVFGLLSQNSPPPEQNP